MKHIDPHEAKDLIEKDPLTVVIDVSRHWNEQHLPGSVQYYLGDGSLDRAIPNLDPTRRYIIYCYLLSHSTESAQKMIDSGFPSVYHLDGGFRAWELAGYEVIYP
jgi:rhodanese-related sulfurtransferase